MTFVNRLNLRGNVKKNEISRSEDTTKQVLEIVDEIIKILSDNDVIVDKIASRDKTFVKKEIERAVNEYNYTLPGHTREELMKHVYDFMYNYSIIQKYVEMPDCNNILINSYDNIWVWIKDKRHETDLSFGSEKNLMTFIYAIRGKLGGRLNANQSLNVFNDPTYRLRIAVGIRPLATRSPTVTIRKQPEKNLKMDDLVNLSMLSQCQADYLIESINLDKSIVFCGKGGSGKTMLMRATIESIRRDRRIFIMEENEELMVEHPGALPYEVRRDRGKYYGIEEYSDFGLLNSIDIYVFGEIRSEEAMAFFNGAYSGNPSLTTGHSYSKEGIIDKLVVNMEQSGTKIPSKTLKEMLLKSIDIIVFLKDFKVDSIGEIRDSVIHDLLFDDIEEAVVCERTV